ncbi:MAG: penicillin-binding protein 2 [Patescibacteria group bacterium]|nr:penicillin-binding protein 2 [Patescibacteria group bacterium]
MSSGEIEISDAIAHGGEHEKRKMEEPVGLNNLKKFCVIIFLVIFVIALRTAYLQIAKGSYYAKKAEQNRINKISVKAPRGIIVDRRGEQLVINVASFDLVLIPTLLPEDDVLRGEVLDNCFSLLNVPRPEKLPTDFYDSYQPHLLQENITREEAIEAELIKNRCPGFVVEKTAIREYKWPLFFSHVLGYTGKIGKEDLKKDSDYLMTDNIGKTGIEKYWEPELRGKAGSVYVEVDSSGKMLRSLEEKISQPGNRLVLGIDGELQRTLYREMEKVLAETGAKKGSAVALDPNSGLVRALISVPGYDNNLFANKIDSASYQELINDPAKPLLNRAISGVYPPGSTIKPLIGIAALEEGTINEHTSFDCHGVIQVGNWSFKDWKTHGPDINLKKAIAESCDVFFYTIGGGFDGFKGLGVSKIEQYEKMFGLGSPTGIDLESERSGFIPTATWKKEEKGERWYIGNTYHISIGQGDITATPLQIANYITVIANGGILYRPHLVAEISDENTGEIIEEIKPEIIKSDFIHKEYLRIVREAMRETVVDGTAKTLNELEVAVAGKTGTAQIGGTENTHSWFVGFAPADNPQLVLAVIVEEGGESSDAAVPVAKEAFRKYFPELSRE